MGVKKIRAVLDAIVNYVYVLLVQCRDEYVVFVRKADLEIARAASAIPYKILVLPVLSKREFKVMLRKLHPLLRSEERALSLSHVLRNEQVKAVYDEVPVVLARRAFVATPKRGVGIESARLKTESNCRKKIVFVLALDRVWRRGLCVEGDVEVVCHVVVGNVGGSVVVDVHLRQVEVAVVDGVFLLEDIPRRVDKRHDGFAPLAIDVGKVVLVDENLRDVASA